MYALTEEFETADEYGIDKEKQDLIHWSSFQSDDSVKLVELFHKFRCEKS